ncbi:O-antigen ligase family protein [Mycoplasmatota bacterium]|nr:O-antigen ligase family protein [Mycoplasmatota bacterium]
MSNILASIYVLLIPIALYKYINKKRAFFIYLLIDILNFLGLLMTLSRGAYLGVFISILLFSIVFLRKKRVLRYGGLLLLISTPILLYKNKFYSIILKYLKGRNFFNDRSRHQIYALGWEKFKQGPIFGQGIKSSEYMINHYLHRPYAHYHNFLLQIAATLGIVGLILFTVIVYHWVKILNKRNNSLILCIVCSIIGVLTHQLFDVSFDLFFFGVYFYTLIGVVEIYRQGDEDDCLKMKIIVKK